MLRCTQVHTSLLGMWREIHFLPRLLIFYGRGFWQSFLCSSRHHGTKYEASYINVMKYPFWNKGKLFSCSCKTHVIHLFLVTASRFCLPNQVSRLFLLWVWYVVGVLATRDDPSSHHKPSNVIQLLTVSFLTTVTTRKCTKPLAQSGIQIDSPSLLVMSSVSCF